MCCCQLASAVAHLLPALTSSCLCFVAPKQGPDSGPKNGATILKLAAQLPNVWSQFWAHGVCVLPSAKSALSCDRLHLPFMFSCAWCQDAGFRMQGTQCDKEGKASIKENAPKMVLAREPFLVVLRPSHCDLPHALVVFHELLSSFASKPL